MLSIKDKNNIINEFPNNINFKSHHNKKINYIKNYQDYYIFIPKGKKFYVWLKNDEPNKCYFLESIKYKPVNCELKHTSIDKSLFNNTLFYGTLINNNDFVIENIIYYKNKFVLYESFKNKCNNYLLPFFTLFNNNLILNSKIVNLIHFYIVPFEINYNNVENKFLEFNIPIYELIQIKNNETHIYNIFNKSLIFKILPTLKNDIYNLYYYDIYSSDFILFDTALVNDNKTSNYLNKIFNLNVKIINNIDCIEMSDSEDEDYEFYQDPNESFLLQKQKIINSNENYFVKCIYNNKFKKWKPIEHINLSRDSIIKNNFCATINKLYK